MPRSRIRGGSVVKFGRSATIVLLIFALNISFSNLPGAVAYADTATEDSSVELETETEQTISEEAASTRAEDMEIVDEKELIEDSKNNEVEQGNELSQLEVTEDIEADTSETMQDDSTVSTAELMEATESAPELEEPELTADFECWTRPGIDLYSFSVEIDSDEDYNLPTGTDFNTTDQASYEVLLPSEFISGKTPLTINDWDGGDFVWTIGESEVEVSRDEDMCDGNTIADLATATPELSTLVSLLEALDSNNECSDVLSALTGDSETGITVFAPSNAAFAGLVDSVSGTDAEVTQLLNNPDELCALILSHVVAGEVISTDATTSPTTLTALGNDLDGIRVQAVNGTIMVDDASVVLADVIASNGIVHVIDRVLLPSSVGMFDPIETDATSPALSCTIALGEMGSVVNGNLCTLVRIDGTPYLAATNGNVWQIEAGVVTLNPMKTTTLFDIVVRATSGNCEQSDPNVMADTNGDDLLGLSMQRGVVAFLEVIDEPAEPTEGEVLGTDSNKKPLVVQQVSYPTRVAQNYAPDLEQTEVDPSEIDSDGDGVVDSEDPEPNNPDVTGLETDDTAESEESDDDSSDNSVLWWFLAGGGAVTIWYLLWQRSGKEF